MTNLRFSGLLFRLLGLCGLVVGAADGRAADPVDVAEVRHEALMIPMRDGVRLSAFAFFPPGDGPWPALLEQRYASLDNRGTHQRYAALAAHGYVVVGANFRGAQKSEGVWDGYRSLGWGERRDGFDLVEWLAAQPWCNGRVGTFGGSQAGYAQNFLAVTQPPHLVCQYMTDTGLSLYHEGYRIGGAVRPNRHRERNAVHCRDPQEGMAWLQRMVSHAVYDEYWQAEDTSRHFDKMNVPCFTVGSWYDFMCTGSAQSFIGRQHRGGPNSRGRQQLLIGPWLHGSGNKSGLNIGELTYPPHSAFDLHEHMVRWFDYHLKGIDTGVQNDPTVRYYVMGALGEPDAPGNVWRTADDWPIAAVDTAYYLQPGGGLSTTRPGGDVRPTAYRSDPASPAPIKTMSFPGARDAREFEAHSDVRVFTTEPLTEPVEWTGLVRAELYVTCTAPDADFIVRVSDVYPDGRSILLVDSIRRGRYREGFEREVLMQPGQVYRVAFELGWTSQIFNRGHRIRIAVASTGAEFYEPNPQTGEPITLEENPRLQVANITIEHAGEHASRVIAPVVKVD